jgi:hypothetical protein
MVLHMFPLPPCPSIVKCDLWWEGGSMPSLSCRVLATFSSQPKINPNPNQVKSSNPA